MPIDKWDIISGDDVKVGDHIMITEKYPNHIVNFEGPVHRLDGNLVDIGNPTCYTAAWLVKAPAHTAIEIRRRRPQIELPTTPGSAVLTDDNRALIRMLNGGWIDRQGEHWTHSYVDEHVVQVLFVHP